MGYSTSQTLQDPILLLRWVYFHLGAYGRRENDSVCFENWADKVGWKEKSSGRYGVELERT
jgi:hypothetical protein